MELQNGRQSQIRKRSIHKVGLRDNGEIQLWSTGEDYKIFSFYIFSRITIHNASRADTGVFTCATPNDQKTPINIVVLQIDCPPIFWTDGLVVSTNKTILATRVNFSCSNNNTLIGPDELTCLSTGQWSGLQPSCEEIFCWNISDIIEDETIQVSKLTNEASGKVEFSCPFGHKLLGAGSASCQRSSQWKFFPQAGNPLPLPPLNVTLPSCVAITCGAPPSPANGSVHTLIQGQTIFQVGDLVNYHCDHGFMMQGDGVAACTEDSLWTNTTPTCITACTYPGTSPGASLDVVQFYYLPQERVRFTCATGTEMRGAPLLMCLNSGQWSGPVPTCV